MYSTQFTHSKRRNNGTAVNTGGLRHERPVASSLQKCNSGGVGGCRVGETSRAAWVSKAVDAMRCAVRVAKCSTSVYQFGFRMGQELTSDWSPCMQVRLGTGPT